MIWPAIDLQNGNSVRLYQGQFNQETLVSPTPVQQARQLNTAGVNRLHLIDLDGAKDGSPQNLTTIKAIRQAFSGQIEVGGGIRSRATIESYLRSGIDRIILGSAAIDNPQFTKQVLLGRRHRSNRHRCRRPRRSGGNCRLANSVNGSDVTTDRRDGPGRSQKLHRDRCCP